MPDSPNQSSSSRLELENLVDQKLEDPGFLKRYGHVSDTVIDEIRKALLNFPEPVLREFLNSKFQIVLGNREQLLTAMGKTEDYQSFRGFMAKDGSAAARALGNRPTIAINTDIPIEIVGRTFTHETGHGIDHLNADYRGFASDSDNFAQAYNDYNDAKLGAARTVAAGPHDYSFRLDHAIRPGYRNKPQQILQHELAAELFSKYITRLNSDGPAGAQAYMSRNYPFAWDVFREQIVPQIGISLKLHRVDTSPPNVGKIEELDWTYDVSSNPLDPVRMDMDVRFWSDAERQHLMHVLRAQYSFSPALITNSQDQPIAVRIYEVSDVHRLAREIGIERTALITSMPWQTGNYPSNREPVRFIWTDEIDLSTGSRLRQALEDVGIEYENVIRPTTGRELIIVQGSDIHRIDKAIIGGASWLNVTDRYEQEARYIDIGQISPEEQRRITNALDAQNISWESKKSGINGGIEVLAISGNDIAKIDAVHNGRFRYKAKNVISDTPDPDSSQLRDTFNPSGDLADSTRATSKGARFSRMASNVPILGAAAGVGGALLTNDAHAAQREYATQLKDQGVLSKEAYAAYVKLNSETEMLLHSDVALSTADPTGLTFFVTLGVEIQAKSSFKDWADQYAPNLTEDQFQTLAMSIFSDKTARVEMLIMAADSFPRNTDGHPEILHSVIHANLAYREAFAAYVDESGKMIHRAASPSTDSGGKHGRLVGLKTQADEAKTTLVAEMEQLMLDPNNIDIFLNIIPTDDRLSYVRRLAASEQNPEQFTLNHPEVALYVQAYEDSWTGWFVEEDILTENTDLLNIYIKEKTGIEVSANTSAQEQQFNAPDIS